jgi:VWD domain-containing protein
MTGTTSSKASFIRWNMNDRSTPEADGVALDPCSSLYHELYHANRHQTDGDSNSMCGNTDLPTDEVEATFAENQYRSKHFKGSQFQRKYYDGKKLPPSLKSCEPKPAPKPKPKKACTAPGGDTAPGLRGTPLLELAGARQEGCEDKSAETNGDPHLTTFDQYTYDFQAVGEFVAAKSGNDFEVQTRQAPVPNLNDRTVSVNSAVAMKVGADKVGLYVDNGALTVHVNGKVEAIALGDKKLSGGGLLTRRKAFQEYKPDGYTVTWPDGSVAELDGIGDWGIRLILSPVGTHKGKLSGLLGNFDGNKDNELLTPGRQSHRPAAGV